MHDFKTCSILREATRELRRAMSLLFVSGAGSVALANLEIHVSPGGIDSAPGSIERPVATLGRAIEIVRASRGHEAEVTILLHDGTHRIPQTLVLGLQDTPAEGGRLTFAAAAGARPIISGGVPIRDWRRVAAGEEPLGTPEIARGKLWVATVPEEISAGRFYTLYDGLTALPRARSRDYVARGPHRGLLTRLENRDLIEFPAGALKRWENLEDVEVLSRPNHHWLVNYLALESVDESTLTARTTVPATYTPTGQFWVENVMEALDEPGEWVVNSRTRRVYLWPHRGEPGEAIVAPVVTTLIRVEGREDFWGDDDKPAGRMRFVGLTFAHTDRDVWTPADAGLQHDWAMFDKDDSCVRFRVAEDCEVRDCTFEAAAGHGIRADLYARNVRIRGNTFRQLGASGILLCGYGPGTKDVNGGHEIVDNEFHDLGTLWWHSPAVFLWQSGGNLVANNYIHHLPYNGIVLSGVRPRHFGISTPKIQNPAFPANMREDLRLMRWREVGNPRTPEEILPFAHTRENVIRDNEIHDAMLVLRDGNGIYLSSAGKGNVIQRNFIYNMGRSAAIRTDDDQSYCKITENVTFGVGIVVKDFNETWNNVMINGGLRITSDRPESRVEQNVFVSYLGRAAFYEVDVVNSYFGNAKNDTMLNNYNPNHKPIIPPKTDRNLFHTSDRAAAEAFVASMQQTWGNDAESVIAAPEFLAPAEGDFRFAPGSPAGALGIQSVDTRKVGLLREPMVDRLRRTEQKLDLARATSSEDRG